MKAIVTVMALTLTATMTLVGSTFATGAAGADPVLTWSDVSDASTVEVVTIDEDGSARETTVWILVQDGHAFVRTGGSRWGDNVVRGGELVLRIDEIDYAMTVTFEEDDTRRAEIKHGFREKYGWFDGMVSWIRGDRPKHMRLEQKP